MKVDLDNKTYHVDIYVDGYNLSEFSIPSDLVISQFSLWVDGDMAAFFVGTALTNCSDFTDEQVVAILKSAISE